MACKFICDGCGKEEVAIDNGRDFFKPHGWFKRADQDGIQIACSRPCIDRIANESGKTAVVAPI